MTDCNTQSWAVAAVPGTGRCNSSPHDTRDSTYLAYRNLAANSLSIQSEAGTASGYAFILVSHGESGAGAFVAEGGTRIAPPSAGTREYPNTQASGTYALWSYSVPGTATSDAAFFDDIVVAVSASDLINSARLTAKSWDAPAPPPTTASQEFTAASIAAAGGNSTQFNTGRNSLNFGTFTVTAFGDTARNVGFDLNVGTGIGAIGTGSNSQTTATANRATNEGLTFSFTQTGRYLGVTLGRFGSESGELERVSFDFVIGGSAIRITKIACRTGDGRANFTINPGGDFDQVTIEPRLTQFFNFSSTLNVSAIATCPSTNAACAAPGAIASEDCP
ncbi:MAG: hypothetical protein IPP91_11620 [Betaproteobacteria bacterium]|nr:hypothetical protein [Betaproteobacteria bacterium]